MRMVSRKRDCVRALTMGKLWGRSVKKQENVSLDSGPEGVDGWCMAMAETMCEKLTAAFAPDALEIVDESAKHAGHSGSRPGGETHFAVRIVSKAFEGVGRVER